MTATYPTVSFPSDLGALQALFEQGRPPDPPLDGRHAGLVVRATLAPVLDPLFGTVASYYMPWLGKAFDPTAQRGANRLLDESLPLLYRLWPHYRGVRSNGDGTYDAFVFRTWTGTGILDPGITALKIDYDLPENPVTVRRILDELVELPDGRLLGKAHLLTWWGEWTTAVYFALTRPSPSAMARD